MATFQIRIRQYDRREGYSNWTEQKIPATSQAAAIGYGVREYMRQLTRKQKRDAAKLLEVKAVRLAELSQ